MNEQIKAIGRQAGFAFIEDGVYGQRWYSSKCGLDASEYEKLVGLIVKECASICELNGQSYKHSFTPVKAKLAESTSVYCGTLIKKHFGVEE